MSETDRRSGAGATHEERDIGPGAAFWFAGSFVAVMALLVAGLTLIAGSAWRPLPDATPEYRLGPLVAEGPRLQVAPESDLRALRDRAEARLGSFGWIDRSAGIAHIPIEEAMALAVRRAGKGRER